MDEMDRLSVGSRPSLSSVPLLDAFQPHQMNWATLQQSFRRPYLHARSSLLVVAFSKRLRTRFTVCMHRTKPCQQQMTLALSIAGVLRERHHDTLIYD